MVNKLWSFFKHAKTKDWIDRTNCTIPILKNVFKIALKLVFQVQDQWNVFFVPLRILKLNLLLNVLLVSWSAVLWTVNYNLYKTIFNWCYCACRYFLRLLYRIQDLNTRMGLFFSKISKSNLVIEIVIWCLCIQIVLLKY